MDGRRWTISRGPDQDDVVNGPDTDPVEVCPVNGAIVHQHLEGVAMDVAAAFRTGDSEALHQHVERLVDMVDPVVVSADAK